MFICRTANKTCKSQLAPAIWLHNIISMVTLETYLYLILFSYFIWRLILWFIYFIRDVIVSIWDTFVKPCLFLCFGIIRSFVIVFVFLFTFILIVPILLKYICSYYIRFIAVYVILLTLPLYLYIQIPPINVYTFLYRYVQSNGYYIRLYNTDFPMPVLYCFVGWVCFADIPSTYMANTEQYETYCMNCTAGLFAIVSQGFCLLLLIGLLTDALFGINIFALQENIILWRLHVLGLSSHSINWWFYQVKKTDYVRPKNIYQVTRLVMKTLLNIINIFWFITEKTAQRTEKKRNVNINDNFNYNNF